MTLLTAITLYLLCSSLYSPLVASVAAGLFCILPLVPKIQGISANAEHFVILPALVGIALLVHSMERRKRWLLFPSGLMLGTAFVVKQHGLAFFLFGLAYFIVGKGGRAYENWREFLVNVGLIVLSALLPFSFILALMIHYGVFDRFWFWTFVYAGRYVSMTSPLEGFSWLRIFMGHLVFSMPVPWLLSFLGLASLLAYRWSSKQKGFALGFLFFSFLAISPGFYYRPHYFIMLLPAICMLAGIALDSIRKMLRQSFVPKRLGEMLVLLLLFAVLGHSVYKNREAFFSMSSAQLLRASYGMNPFIEAVEIARQIQARSGPEETIAVVGSEPEIYFYAERRAATGYLYTYPLTENHPFAERMQREMIAQIEKAMPGFWSS